MLDDSTIARFWPKVGMAGPDECWEWRASRLGKGYGQLGKAGGGGILLAHRISYELHHGPIPADLIVRHKCDNPPCVNPSHLEVGTYSDNMWDKEARGRGRHPRGEQCGNAKLTADQVREIRALPRYSKLAEISERFGISRRHAATLRHRQSLWRHA